MIEERAPQQVAASLESGDGVYLDVRTEAEFAAGHVPGALNVPVAEQDPATGMMGLNPEFVRVVRASIAADTTVYCGCASGPRSRHAVTLLREAGYARCINVRAGFHGTVDPLGRVIESGWAALGLPVEAGDGGPFGYAALRAGCGDDD